MRLQGEAITALPLQDDDDDEEEMSLSDDEEAVAAGSVLLPPPGETGQIVRGGAAQRIYCDDTTKFCQVRCKLCDKLMAYDGILGRFCNSILIKQCC